MPEQPALHLAGTPELEDTTESEEMYLITVARAVEEGTPEPVPIGAIAEALSVSVTSVNEMVKRLAERGLLNYEPYHGVRLSRTGRAIADRVLRSRRLWATFLAEKLGFSPIEADDQACHLEHVTAPDAAERLAAFLGKPEADPLGRPIPTPDATVDSDTPALRLVDAAVGDRVEVLSVDGSARAVSFLNAEGITSGVRLVVLAAGGSGFLVQGNSPVHVSLEMASDIHVRPETAPW
jgi:DtxR family Mn-dependent transcriptional regulator